MKNLAMVLRMNGDEAGLDQLRPWAETLAAADGPHHEAWLYGGEFFAELGQWERAERFIAKSMLSPGASDRKARNLARIQRARQQEAKKALAEGDGERPKSNNERKD
ncbi:MAG: hypothetical protein H0T51_16865 [Pirellulales bacterium]|nr:hypothetical protein [Pirellulales bacterium]